MHLEKALDQRGWHPERPSRDCRAITEQFALAVRQRLVDEVDRVRTVRSLVCFELGCVMGKLVAKRFKDPLGQDELGQRIERASVWHALRSLGHAGDLGGGRWGITSEEEEDWAARINDRDQGVRDEIEPRWVEANDLDASALEAHVVRDIEASGIEISDAECRDLALFQAVRRNPGRFEPILSLEVLLERFGYVDPEKDLGVMRAALRRVYPEGKSWVSMAEMPGVFDLVRKTQKGSERRLMYPSDGHLRLGFDEVVRGFDSLLETEKEVVSPVSINTSGEREFQPAADPAFEPEQTARMAFASVAALAALADLRARAEPDSALAIVLEPENLSFRSDGASLAALARRVNRPEATIRQAWNRVEDEVRRRLSV